MIGRRVPDTVFGELPDAVLEPGDYWKYLTKEGVPMDASDRHPSNLTGGVWGYYSPDGNGIGTLMQHTVREEEDGSISVLPGDGSSNSILHSGGMNGAGKKTWHGYVYSGEWRTC